MVAAAVELAGGVTAVAKLCGVARQSVYTWIEEWRVERLIDALKLARASGIPIERLAGEAFKPERIPAAKVAGILRPVRRRVKKDSMQLPNVIRRLGRGI